MDSAKAINSFKTYLNALDAFYTGTATSGNKDNNIPQRTGVFENLATALQNALNTGGKTYVRLSGYTIYPDKENARFDQIRQDHLQGRGNVGGILQENPAPLGTVATFFENIFRLIGWPSSDVLEISKAMELWEDRVSKFDPECAKAHSLTAAKTRDAAAIY